MWYTPNFPQHPPIVILGKEEKLQLYITYYFFALKYKLLLLQYTHANPNVNGRLGHISSLLVRIFRYMLYLSRTSF